MFDFMIHVASDEFTLEFKGLLLHKKGCLYSLYLQKWGGKKILPQSKTVKETVGETLGAHDIYWQKNECGRHRGMYG